VFSVVRAAVVFGQRLGKHVPAAMSTNTTIKERCFQCGTYHDVTSKGKISVDKPFCTEGSSAREAIKIEPERVKVNNLRC
jgi:hypothetical protein